MKHERSKIFGGDIAVRRRRRSPRASVPLEADPRVAKVLHAAFEGSSAKRAATKLANLAKGQQVQPAKVLKGTSGASPVSPSTKDFAAFEKLANKALAKG